MISRVVIDNFKSCVHTVIDDDLGKVIALVGRNGAGKTNILQAIAAGTSTAVASSINLSLFAPFYLEKRFRIELDFRCGHGPYRYILQFGMANKPPGPLVLSETLYRQSQGDVQPLLERNGSQVRLADRPEAIRIGELSPCVPAVRSLLPEDDAIVPELKSVTQFLAAVRYYPIDEPAVRIATGIPVVGKQYSAWHANYLLNGEPTDSVLMRLIFMDQERKEDLGVLKSWLGPDGLSLIDDIRVDSFVQQVPSNSSSGSGSGPGQGENTYYFVNFFPPVSPGQHPQPVSAESLSAGTRRILKLLVSLIFDGSTVALVEQPEDGLHQGLTKKLIGLLETNADSQLIMSSHSSALVNRLRPENIRLVSHQSGSTVARALTQKETAAAIRFLNDDGPLYDALQAFEEE